jgi:hypothetical protein
MEANIKQLVEKLMSGTLSKKLTWESTERDSQFRLRTSKGFLTVDHWTGTDDETGREFDCTDIAFLNSKGETIESFVYDMQFDIMGWRALRDLNDAARRSALKIDEKIGEILAEIDQKLKDS